MRPFLLLPTAPVYCYFYASSVAIETFELNTGAGSSKRCMESFVAGFRMYGLSQNR